MRLSDWPYLIALAFGGTFVLLAVTPITFELGFAVIGMLLLLVAFDARLSTWID